MRATIVKQGQLHNEHNLFAYAVLPNHNGGRSPWFATETLSTCGRMLSIIDATATNPVNGERLLRDLLPHSALIRKRRC